MTLAASPVLAVGCGGGDPPGIEQEPGFVPVQCEGGTPLWTPDLTPEPPVDYLELRTFSGSESRGVRCENATDDEVIGILTREQVLSFLGPIDTHGEALFVAALAGYDTRLFGGTPRAPRLEPLPSRDLEALAIENAAEGCVRETYGALTATWQSLKATDEDLSIAYQRIARDELRHARLAWRVARWADQRLDSSAQRRVREASIAAAHTLHRELHEDVHPDLVRLAGVPRPAAAQRLFSHLAARLWAPPSA